MARITREKFKTYEGVFDNFTLRNLFTLSGKGIIDELKTPIALGKEANVFIASSENGPVVVKIYRLETCDFNKMYQYISMDPRFISMSKSRRKVIFAWTQREYRNLMKARENHVRVPKPLYFHKNILIEEFIGYKEKPAPKMKDYLPRAKKKFFDDLIEQVRRFYKAGFIHGDLSAFNVLVKDDKPVLIDFSQAMPYEHDIDMLRRDIHNIVAFFNKTGMKIDEEKVLKKITC